MGEKHLSSGDVTALRAGFRASVRRVKRMKTLFSRGAPEDRHMIHGGLNCGRGGFKERDPIESWGGGRGTTSRKVLQIRKLRLIQFGKISSRREQEG